MGGRIAREGSSVGSAPESESESESWVGPVDDAAGPDAAGPDAGAPLGPPRRWWPVLVGAALALLLVGGAVGLSVGRSSAPSVQVPSLDSVDVGFAQDMTVHHEQAVEMASWVRDHTTDPTIGVLAFDIESTQQRQIGRMQGWLGLWGAPPLPSGGYMGWMGGAGAHGHGGATPAAGGKVNRMPGMATDAELKQLRATTGKQLDVLFLQLMLRHHEGGVGMLSYGAEHAAQTEVRNLADQMLRAQTAENAYLKRLLSERGAQPLPS